MEDEDFRLIELTVRVWVQKDADLQDTVDELEYTITHPLIIDTEITDWKEI